MGESNKSNNNGSIEDDSVMNKENYLFLFKETQFYYVLLIYIVNENKRINFFR